MDDFEKLNSALRLAHKLTRRMTLLRVSLEYRNARDSDRRVIRRNIAMVRETQADLREVLS